MPCHVQIVVGVVCEMEIGEGGTLLMQKEIPKDSKLVAVRRNFLVATKRVIQQPFSPKPLLPGQWKVCCAVVVVCGWFAKSSYSRSAQTPPSKVLKEQGCPAVFPKLLKGNSPRKTHLEGFFSAFILN